MKSKGSCSTAPTPRRYYRTGKFEYVNTGGYYHSLPGDPLRRFIDTCAEVQRAMGFQNEKDHPEVAPSQFEINYGYGEVVAAADQIQLYKLICRQAATGMGLTASFLPKPVLGVNGNGMHTNVSISKGGKNLFWDPKGEEKMRHARLVVRRSDPDPRQRHLPAAQSQRERVSPPRPALRSAQPDQGLTDGPWLHGAHPDRQREERPGRGTVRRPGREPVSRHVLDLPGGIEGDTAKIKNLRQAERYLPDNIYTAIEHFRDAKWTTDLLGADVKGRYADLKQASADRCPRLLGTIVKAPEVQYHHEVYNQFLWNKF